MAVALDETQPATPSEGGGVDLPATIHRFQVESKLGEGGNGVVVLARDPSVDRKVAIKILRRAGDAEARQRLLREAQSVAKLAHDNVIVVHEAGTEGDQVYVAMEYVPGGTLATWQAGKSWSECVETYTRAGRGLAAAHAAGLVHRDFKPDNVLVSQDGRVRVTDFGLVSVTGTRAESVAEARALAGRALATSLTCTGAVLGTPKYMAPEQHLGEEVDARADQFAFSVALYEAVYGHAPFEGETYDELLANVVAGRRTAFPDDTEVPLAINAAIIRGLARDRDDRFPSLTVMLDALIEAAAPMPERAAADAAHSPGRSMRLGQASRAGGSKRFARRRATRARVLTTLAAVGAGAVLATGAWVLTHEARPPEASAAAAAPDNADDDFKAGEDAYNAADFKAAIRHFKRAFELEPNLAGPGLPYLYDLGQAYRQDSDCENAALVFKRYLALKADMKEGARAQLEQRIRELDECVEQRKH